MQNLFNYLLDKVIEQLTNKPEYRPLQLRSYSKFISSQDASSIEILIIELMESNDEFDFCEVLDFNYSEFIQNYIIENLMLHPAHKLDITKTGWQTQINEVDNTFDNTKGDDVYQYFSVLITDQTIYITRNNPAL